METKSEAVDYVRMFNYKTKQRKLKMALGK